jgi:hypothetical protein
MADELHRIPADLVTAITRAGGHTVSHTIDPTEPPHRVGTCECGEVFRVPRDGTDEASNIARCNEMEAMIEAHWRYVLADATAQAAGA